MSLHPVAGLQMVSEGVYTWHARMILKDLEQLSSWFQNRYEMVKLTAGDQAVFCYFCGNSLL